MRFNYSKTQT